MANAAIFNFSFTNENGPVPGTVSGTITLPDGDGTFPATSVEITSAPAGLGYTLPINMPNGNVLQNTFTVVGGMIDAAVSSFFNVFPGDNSAFALNDTGFAADGRSFIDASTGGFLGDTGVQDLDSSTLTYSAAPSATTPEPTSVITLIGVGVLGVASKLKKKA